MPRISDTSVDGGGKISVEETEGRIEPTDSENKKARVHEGVCVPFNISYKFILKIMANIFVTPF